ncbi:MAG: C69 family dipeptidase [Clostridia bacterium]|nr:C69 family dipeptidase [Clostridia bacterium]
MKKMVTLVLALALAMSGASALACTGFYVGKQASTSGATIIGHTVDAFTYAQALAKVVPSVENTPGRTLNTFSSVEYPLPDTTFQYTSTPFNDGRWDGGTANSNGVAVSAAVTCSTTKEIAELDPRVRDGGLAEAFLCALVGATATSARNAVEIMGDYIYKYGNAECNSILIADQNEAWVMETYTGHEWCAVKMPEDCVAVYGNQFMIGAVDPQSEDVMCSPKLFSMPEEAGLAVYTEDGFMDLFATYAGGKLGDNSNRRTWYGHVLFAPSTAGEYATETRYDFFYQPDEKVSLKDVLEMTRSRFEGTEFDPDANDLIGMRIIGVENQINCNAIEVYDNLPADMACVTWSCMANAEHSVYLPMSNLITDTAAAFHYVNPVGSDPAEHPVGSCDENMAHFNFKRLCTLSEQDRVNYGAGVRAYWNDVENALIAEYPDILAKTLAIYGVDKEAAAAYITDYTIRVQEKALEDAKLMYDELLWYMITNTKTTQDPAELVPFQPSILEVEEEAAETAEAA